MTLTRVRLVLAALLLTGALSAAGPIPAHAQDTENEWWVTFTPQVWLSHIAKNGFAANTTPITLNFGNPFRAAENINVESGPTSAIDPQWGGQLSVNRGNWTLAVAAQYVSFTTRNDVTSVGDNVLTQGGRVAVLSNGATLGQEFVETDRFDLDVAATHFFSDVVKNILDVNAGMGFKFIYASASRNYSNGATLTNLIAPGLPPNPNPTPASFNYFVCSGAVLDTSTLAGCQVKNRVQEDDYFYGATFPISLNFHLSQNNKWFLPVNLAPFLGAEVRNDRNVVYAVAPGPSGGNTSPFQIKRLDGTAFAKGVTADAGVRYAFDNGIALYGGFRVQFIEGLEQYLAWGPLVNMSVRFGK